MMKKIFYASPDNTELFSDPEMAVAYIRKIYDTNTAFLRDSFQALARDEEIPQTVSACYPYAAITVRQRDLRRHAIDPKSSYGFVSQEGQYSITLTRPDIFAEYYQEMLGAIMRNHCVSVEVGISDCPIPIHFAFPDGMHIEGGLDDQKLRRMREVFDSIDLTCLSDYIVDNKKMTRNGDEKPLALYSAPRVDVSLQRLRHYTGTDPAHFQKFVLFTNYQFYVDEFRRLARESMQKSDASPEQQHRAQYTSFVEPGNHVFNNQNSMETAACGQPLPRMPQMPAYHLTREDGNGITLVNIGIGPSNAKTISDHIAVLRPHAWIMVGHCGGLRSEMEVGDYVLAHGYDRRDQILDSKLPLSTVIPALAEIQQALQQTVQDVTGRHGLDVRGVMRTGTVVTVADRNWELDGLEEILAAFNPSRPVAVDMESGTLAANGFRHRVPYGTLLCVSDMPLHGLPKMPGPSEEFYRERVAQHIMIGIETCERLCRNPEGLHSRKLRGSFEPAFR
jgi:AMP nucleosidase